MSEPHRANLSVRIGTSGGVILDDLGQTQGDGSYEDYNDRDSNGTCDIL
jgi:hypothetical protein